MDFAGVIEEVGTDVAGFVVGDEVYGCAGGLADLQGTLAEYILADHKLNATPIDFTKEKVADYVEKYTQGKGFDTIFDAVGGPNLTNSFEAAALNAHIATTVSLVELDLSAAHFKGLSLHVVFMLIPMLHNHKREIHGQILTKLADIIDNGYLKPILDESDFSLEQIGLAHDRLASGNALGKVVVTLKS